MTVGTVRTMGQIGAVHAYLALVAGVAQRLRTGSMLLAVIEAYVTLQMCLAIAYHVGLRFAGLR